MCYSLQRGEIMDDKPNQNKLEQLEQAILGVLDNAAVLRRQLMRIRDDVRKYEIGIEVIKEFEKSIERQEMIEELEDLVRLKKKEYDATHTAYTNDVKSLVDYYKKYVALAPKNDDICMAVEEFLYDAKRETILFKHSEIK